MKIIIIIIIIIMIAIIITTVIKVNKRLNKYVRLMNTKVATSNKETTTA